MEGRTDIRTDSPCVLQDFVPFGAAAQLLPLNLNHTRLKQGTGTADHLLPWGTLYTPEDIQSRLHSTLLPTFAFATLHCDKSDLHNLTVGGEHCL